MSYLRPSDIDGAKHAWAILALLVKRLRREWPELSITFRGDSGFCRHKMLAWCEAHQVSYITGIAGNKRLDSLSKTLLSQAKAVFERTGEKQKLFADITYAAKSWSRERRVIVKAEYSEHGPNSRYIVTSLPGEAQTLYETVYCARGDMENRIKEQQLYLFADRTSAHAWWANQMRLLLSSMAYILLETLRRLAFKGHAFAKAQCHTIRLKLLKIGAVIVRNTRRIRFFFPSAYPHQTLFRQALRFFNSA